MKNTRVIVSCNLQALFNEKSDEPYLKREKEYVRKTTIFAKIVNLHEHYVNY